MVSMIDVLGHKKCLDRAIKQAPAQIVEAMLEEEKY